jgi:hypothetical protein
MALRVHLKLAVLAYCEANLMAFHVAKMTLFCVTEHLKLAVLAYCEEEKPNRETSK